MNITIYRNTAQTLTWTKSGDYSSDTIKFTVKADRTLTSARSIDKTASVSVSDGVSTFTVTLTPSDSASLSSDSYYYDLRVETSSTDRELLFDGIAYLDKSVRNDTDGSSVSTSSTVTTVTGADFDANDTLGSDGTDIIGRSASEMKTLLGLPKDHVIAYPTLYVSAGGDPQELMATKLNTTSSTPTITKTGVGKYLIDFVDTGISLSSMNTTSKIVPILSAVYNSLPTDYTMVATLNTTYLELQFKDSGVNAELPNGTLLNVLIDVQRWV